MLNEIWSFNYVWQSPINLLVTFIKVNKHFRSIGRDLLNKVLADGNVQNDQYIDIGEHNLIYNYRFT